MSKYADKRESVRIVKLCCPLSHLVISLGRFPVALANSTFEMFFSLINDSMRLDIANSMSTSLFIWGGTSFTIALNFDFVELILLWLPVCALFCKVNNFILHICKTH